MHLYTNKINDLRNQEKEPTRKMRNSLLPPRCRLAVARQSLLRKRRKSGIRQTAAHALLSADGPRTGSKGLRATMPDRTASMQKSRLEQTAPFESESSFLSPDSKGAALNPNGPYVRCRA